MQKSFFNIYIIRVPSAQIGVRLKNKFFNRKFVLAHNKLDMHKEHVQE